MNRKELIPVCLDLVIMIQLLKVVKASTGPYYFNKKCMHRGETTNNNRSLIVDCLQYRVLSMKLIMVRQLKHFS